MGILEKRLVPRAMSFYDFAELIHVGKRRFAERRSCEPPPENRAPSRRSHAPFTARTRQAADLRRWPISTDPPGTRPQAEPPGGHGADHQPFARAGPRRQ